MLILWTSPFCGSTPLRLICYCAAFRERARAKISREKATSGAVEGISRNLSWRGAEPPAEAKALMEAGQLPAGTNESELTPQDLFVYAEGMRGATRIRHRGPALGLCRRLGMYCNFKK